MLEVRPDVHDVTLTIGDTAFQVRGRVEVQRFLGAAWVILEGDPPEGLQEHDESACPIRVSWSGQATGCKRAEVTMARLPRLGGALVVQVRALLE